MKSPVRVECLRHEATYGAVYLAWNYEKDSSQEGGAYSTHASAYGRKLWQKTHESYRGLEKDVQSMWIGTENDTSSASDFNTNTP